MKKIITATMVLFMFLCTSLTSFAAEEEKQNAITCTENDSETVNTLIEPREYHDYGVISFKGRYTSEKKWFDGGHMALEVACRSNTPGLKIQAIIHIADSRAIMRDVPVDGATYKWDWIDLGTNTGRDVWIEYVCDQNPNAVIEVKSKAYSW